jgi:hypothetical protein
MGGKSTAATDTKYVGVQVQQSVKAAVIPMGWGTFKVSCNLLDYLDFKAASASASAGGKGGSSSKTYSYSASVLLGLCAGPVAGVRTVYRDQSVYTDGATTALAQVGLSLVTGAIGQGPWSYLVSSHPDHAIGYSGLSYVCAANSALNASATVPNHSFEVQSAVRQTLSGGPNGAATVLDDANPADIVAGLLAAVPQWPAGALSDLTDYATYCLAAGLLLSPVLDSQRQGSDVLTEILTASNADAVWSDGMLKIVAYGDTPVSANGASWTPDLTPLYDLTDDDFIASPNEDPVQRQVSRPADAYNSVQVEFLDRTQQYATDMAPALDQANIDAYGLRRQNPTSLHCICDPAVAAHVAQLLVQRSANVRKTYSFTLDERYGLLDPLDLVTLTSGRLERTLVRLTEVDEGDDGSIDCTAEEMLVGVAHAALYSRQAAGGYVSNFDAPPGPVSPPVLINPPVGYVSGAISGVTAAIGGVTATQAAYEAWAAVAGTSPFWGGCEVWASLDGDSYQKVGEIDGAARYGVSTADFPAGPDPDTTDSLSLDLSASLGQLDPATQAEADGGATVSILGGEMIGWRDATLTGPNQYRLGGYIRRGLFGTPIADHPAGSEFVRLDDQVFRYAYTTAQAGKTLYLKFPSFNVYGRATQGLDEAAAYAMALTPNTSAAFVEIKAQGIVGQGALATLDTADTAQIAYAAVTNSITAEDTSSVPLGPLNAAPVLVGAIAYACTGAPIRLDILVEIANTDEDHDQNYAFTAYRDTTLIKSWSGWTRQNSANVAGGWKGQTVTFFFDTGALAGEHTWSVYAQATAGTGNASTKDLSRLCLLELKDQLS